MAVPKKRQSKTRRNKRRQQHDRTSAASIGVCSGCGEPKLSHRICPSCGAYRGETVIEIKEVE